MKYILLVSIIALLILSNKMASGSCAHRMAYEDEHVDNSKKTFPFAMNNFTLKLFQTIADSSDENILFFPLNIAKLLFMVFLGSTGHVAQQIEDTLNMFLHTSTYHTTIHNFFYEWENSENKSIYKSADNIFVASSVSLRRKYKIVLRMFYPNGLKSVHFPEAIEELNALINPKTHGRIGGAGAEINTTSDTLLLLLSVADFIGKWNANLQSKTEESSLQNGGSNSNFVSASLNYRKDQLIHCQMIELPMVSKSISLLLVLPSRQENFNTLLKTINPDILHSWIHLEGFEKTQVVFENVKLNLRCDLHLERILPKLGITDLFKKPGGLSKMSFRENLFVNGFIQKSFMQIVASAGTKTQNTDQSNGGIVIRLNTPYFFFIVDKGTNMIISAGSVMDQQREKRV